jgi:hypothetical protein
MSLDAVPVQLKGGRLRFERCTPWTVHIRVRPTAEERFHLDELERANERDEHGRRWIPHAVVMARLERDARRMHGSTRAQIRTWRRRLSRARHTRNRTRWTAAGLVGGQTCIVVSTRAETVLIPPPWHRRPDRSVYPDDGPVLVCALHDDAPAVADLWALKDEILRELQAAWDARVPWEEVGPRLREKYAAVWLDASPNLDTEASPS